MEAAACGKKGARVESQDPRSLGTLESLAAVLAVVLCGWEPRRASLRRRAGKGLAVSGSRAGGRLRTQEEAQLTGGVCAGIGRTQLLLVELN